MKHPEIVNSDSFSDTFKQLLLAIKANQPRCKICAHELGDDKSLWRVRHSDAGQPEKICRFCFNSEIALQFSANARN